MKYEIGRAIATVALCACIGFGMWVTKDASLTIGLILGLFLIW